MTVLEPTDGVTIHVGDVRQVLPTLPAESVDLVATSPPFYGLRDYGTGEWEGGDPDCGHERQSAISRGSSSLEGAITTQGGTAAYRDVCGKCGARRVDSQIGLEATPEQWAAELVAVFRECRRLLRPGGSMFVEIGDSYASHGQNAGSGNANEQRDDGIHNGFKVTAASLKAKAGARGFRPRSGDLKPKDLIGQPFLLAFALRADGWYWRGCYIWAKSNGMPESARDRCTVSHSYVLHFAKNSRYHFDADAIAEDSITQDQRRPYTSQGAWALDGRPVEQRHGGELRNGHDFTSKHPRSVWTIPTYGFPGAHFAVFPPRLVERMILAGCPREVCSVCGKARERIVEQTPLSTPTYSEARGYTLAGAKDTITRLGDGVNRSTVGWSDCGHDAYQPGVTLDPFFGSGTTGVVARRHGRHAVGVELNPTYARMAADRCAAWWRDPVREDDRDDDGQMPLFDAPRTAAPSEAPRGLTGGAYSPPGQSPHSNARPKAEEAL